MVDLIFANESAFNTFETTMRLRTNIPAHGTNAETGENVNPGVEGARGWTTAFTSAFDEVSPAGDRKLAKIRAGDKSFLDPEHISAISTDADEIAKFGTLVVTVTTASASAGASTSSAIVTTSTTTAVVQDPDPPTDPTPPPLPGPPDPATASATPSSIYHCGLDPAVLSAGYRGPADFDNELEKRYGGLNESGGIFNPSTDQLDVMCKGYGVNDWGWYQWWGHFLSGGLVAMSRFTGDTKYVELALQMADRQISQRLDVLHPATATMTYWRVPPPYIDTLAPGPFWIMNRSSTNDSALALHTGRICWGMLEACDLVKSDSRFSSLEGRADTVISRCKESLFAYSTMIKNQTTLGYEALSYIAGSADNWGLTGPIIHNQWQHFMAGIALLNKLDPDADTATWMARGLNHYNTWAGDNTTHSDGTVSVYAFQRGHYGDNVEDTNHWAYQADFAFLLWELENAGHDGFGMTENQMNQFAKTIATRTWSSIDNSATQEMDGSGGLASTGDSSRIAASFLKYAPRESDIATFAVDFYNANIFDGGSLTPLELEGLALLIEATQSC